MSVKQPRTRKFMAHEPGFTIIDAMNRLFSGVVRRRELLGWDAWRVILKAASCAADDEAGDCVLQDHRG
jgi:hypothetical protein